jgi:transposase-like protein
MKKKSHTPEQIVRILWDAEAKLATGQTVEQVCRELGIGEGTYYKRRKQYGMMRTSKTTPKV